MLTLRRLEVEGFGLYADRAVLEFPEQGVTVVYGDNMRGKTHMMNAIRYAFFGEIHGHGGRIRGTLSACNRDLVAQGKYGFSVALSVTYEGQDYDLVREAKPKVDAPDGDEDFTSTLSMRRGGVVLGPAERNSVLPAMLPKSIARFFLFDGELLDQYAELLVESEEGRLISEAIEQILGVPILRDARDHLTVLGSEASRAKAAEASKHQKTQALGVSLQQANDTRQAHVDELDRAKERLEDLYAEREEIETELRRQEVYAIAVDRLDIARKDRKAARETQEAQKAELKATMAEAWRTALDGAVATTKDKARDAVQDAFALIATSLRAKAVDTSHCATCEQDVPEAVRVQLAATLPSDANAVTVTGDSVGMTALARASELDGFQRKDVRGEVRLIWEAIRAARIAEAGAEGRIADANKTLDGRDPGELRRRKTTLTELGGKIQASQDAIKAHEEMIVEQDEAIARFSKRLAAAGTPELAAFELRERVLARAHAVFEAAVERYKAELRGRVEASATDLFLKMTTEKQEYARLSINDHYGLTIIHTDGRAEDSRSAGAEQVVALALMGALQANAPLRGPIVMDTPFGRLDPNHTTNVVTALPTMAEQVVLLVQEGEIDRGNVREILGPHLKKEYQLDKQSARRTSVTEAR
jgi:DNA sulfur modification protein DndD